MAALGKGVLGVLGQIVSLLSGGVAGALKLVNNLVFGGFKMAMQFNESAMAFSRQAGLTAKQAQAYTEVLATRAKNLGEKYGIAAEEVAKLEKNLARATGRVIMLSDAEAERQIQINRTVGEDTANQFSQSIMRTMGGQLSTVQGAVSKAYATAARKGLDAAGMAAKVGQNLGMANRLTFKNGVDGLTKMVALSEKLGFNVQSLESAANSFMDLQDAIENSAKLSMLGGAAGAFGGNPLDMTYEANYDPEAFGERMTKMLAGYAQFDEKTGMSKMNAMSRDFVKGIADAMHISLDEASSIAKKQAEIRYKNNRFGNEINALAGGDENKRDFILNKAQYDPNANGGRGGLTLNGKDLDYYQKTKEGQDALKDMMKFNNMSDEDVLREQASAVVSIKDRIEGWITTLQGIMAEKISPFLPKIQAFLGDLFNIFKPHVGKIADNVKELLTSALNPENVKKVTSYIETLVTGFGKLASFLTSGWLPLLAAAFFTPMLGLVTSIATGMGFGKGGSIGTGAKGKNGGGWGGSRQGSFKDLYNRNRQLAGNGRFRSAWNAAHGRTGLNGNAKLLTRSAKFGGGIAAAIGAFEIGSTIKDYSDRKAAIEADDSLSAIEKQKEIENAAKERNRSIAGTTGSMAAGTAGAWIGGAIGSAIAPGIGTAIGAALGGAVAGWLGSKGGEAIADAVQGKPEEHSKGGAVGGKATPAGEDILTYLGNKELVLNEPQQNTVAKGLQPTALPVGQKEYIYVPQNASTSNVGNNTVTVNDINVKFSGSLRLDGGSAYRDIDIKELLNDPIVIAFIAEKLRGALNSNVYMKEMHDTKFNMGYSEPSTIAGHMRNI